MSVIAVCVFHGSDCLFLLFHSHRHSRLTALPAIYAGVGINFDSRFRFSSQPMRKASSLTCSNPRR